MTTIPDDPCDEVWPALDQIDTKDEIGLSDEVIEATKPDLLARVENVLRWSGTIDWNEQDLAIHALALRMLREIYRPAVSNPNLGR